jgi:uncharacterized protein YecE (DUF72 family)
MPEMMRPRHNRPGKTSVKPQVRVPLLGEIPVAGEFISSLQPLEKADKLGPVLFQLPPNLKCDVPLLTEYLTELPRHLLAAFEFRNVSWFEDEVFTALRKRNAALCHAESETFHTAAVQTADFFYLCLRKDSHFPKVSENRNRRSQISPGEVRSMAISNMKSPGNVFHVPTLW